MLNSVSNLTPLLRYTSETSTAKLQQPLSKNLLLELEGINRVWIFLWADDYTIYAYEGYSRLNSKKTFEL